MLLAPFTLTESFVDRRREASKRLPDVPSWLLVWAIGGLVAFALFSSLRGGGFAGMSMPFWLVGAPLINLAWLVRGHWTVKLRASISRALVGPRHR
ncbi:MAG: hypothetical protein IPP82_01165 [Xanthomonadales bacterium]|nr:hypothetical protein [Xanthomonadales bacterium]